VVVTALARNKRIIVSVAVHFRYRSTNLYGMGFSEADTVWLLSSYILDHLKVSAFTQESYEEK